MGYINNILFKRKGGSHAYDWINKNTEDEELIHYSFFILCNSL